MIALWTCHLLHWSWQHALLNAIAALPPLFAMRRRKWQLVRFVLFAAPVIALTVRMGFAGEYRGASGVVVAMWVYAAVVTRAGPMLLVIAAKLAAEALGLAPAHEGFVTVALAHYAGATVGLIAGYFEVGLMSETLIASSLTSPETVTSWPTFFMARSWLSSL